MSTHFKLYTVVLTLCYIDEKDLMNMPGVVVLCRVHSLHGTPNNNLYGTYLIAADHRKCGLNRNGIEIINIMTVVRNNDVTKSQYTTSAVRSLNLDLLADIASTMNKI